MVTSNAMGWVSLPLTAGVQLTAGTRYWLVIAANGSKTVTYRDMGSGGSNLDYSGSGLTSVYQVSGHWAEQPSERVRRLWTNWEHILNFFDLVKQHKHHDDNHADKHDIHYHNNSDEHNVNDNVEHDDSPG